MQSDNNKGLFFGAAALGLALVAASAVGAYAFLKAKASGNTIAVTGSAERTINSDTAKWTCGFSRNAGPDGLKGGYDAMAKDLEATLAHLKAQGVTDDEITVNPSNMYPTYDYAPGGGQGKLNGYSLNQQITVKSKRVAEIAKLAQEAPRAISAQGVLFASQGLEYYYSKFSDLKVEMLAEATKNAKARAEKIAQSTGAAVNFLQSASMGVFQVTAPQSMDISDYGYFDTSTVEKKVTAVVKASFSLK